MLFNSRGGRRLMAHEAKLNQVIEENEINPCNVLVANNIPNNGAWELDEGKFYFETINGETVTQSQYNTWKAAKTVEQWKKINDPE